MYIYINKRYYLLPALINFVIYIISAYKSHITKYQLNIIYKEILLSSQLNYRAVK